MSSELLDETVWYAPEGCELAWTTRDGELRGLTRYIDGAWVDVCGPVPALCDLCGAFAHRCSCVGSVDPTEGDTCVDCGELIAACECGADDACGYCERPIDLCVCDEAHDEPELFG